MRPNNENPPYQLTDIFLPYRDIGLSEVTFLIVKFEQDKLDQAKLGPIKPRNNLTTPTKISTLNFLYHTPGKWNKEADRIYNELFNDIVRHLEGRVTSINQSHKIYNELKKYKRYYKRDYGRRLHKYAMYWCLNKLMKEQVKLYANNPSDSAFLRQIQEKLSLKLGEPRRGDSNITQQKLLSSA